MTKLEIHAFRTLANQLKSERDACDAHDLETDVCRRAQKLGRRVTLDEVATRLEFLLEAAIESTPSYQGAVNTGGGETVKG